MIFEIVEQAVIINLEVIEAAPAGPGGSSLTLEQIAAIESIQGKVDHDDPRLADQRTPAPHDHDDRYYTGTEVDEALAAKANKNDPRFTDARAPTAHGHTASHISDLTEAIQDTVASFLGGSNVGISASHDDEAGTLTLTVTGGTADPEAIRDAIGAAIIGVGFISVSVNDAADTITISTTATQNATDAQLRDRSTHTGQQPTSSISGFATAITTAISDWWNTARAAVQAITAKWSFSAGLSASQVDTAQVGTVTNENVRVVRNGTTRIELSATDCLVHSPMYVRDTETAQMRLESSGALATGRAVHQFINTAGNVANGYDFGYNLDQSSRNFELREITNGTATVRMVIVRASGRFGFGVSVPTATLHLRGGSASANSAPVKLIGGPLMNTPEAGALEYDGTNLFFTNNAGLRRQIQFTT